MTLASVEATGGLTLCSFRALSRSTVPSIPSKLRPCSASISCGYVPLQGGMTNPVFRPFVDMRPKKACALWASPKPAKMESHALRTRDLRFDKRRKGTRVSKVGHFDSKKTRKETTNLLCVPPRGLVVPIEHIRRGVDPASRVPGEHKMKTKFREEFVAVVRCAVLV